MQTHEVIVPVILFLSVAAVIVTLILSRHKERLAMLDKGLSSEEIKSLYTRQYRRDPLSSLKWGILFVMAGLAVLAGYACHNSFNLDEGIIIGGIVPLFLGIGLLLFYRLASLKKTEG